MSSRGYTNVRNDEFEMGDRNEPSTLEAQTTSQALRRVLPTLSEWVYSKQRPQRDFLQLRLEEARNGNASHQATIYFSNRYIDFFIRQYERIHQCPAKAILLPIFHYIALQSPSSTDVLLLGDEESLTSFLERLTDKLHTVEENSLQICCISAENHIPKFPKRSRLKATGTPRYFSFTHKMMAAFEQKKNYTFDLYDTPRRAIAYVLAQEWHIPEEVMTAILELNQSTIPRLVYRLPSLDVKPFSESIRVSWALNAPKYIGFLETSIWRPHEKPPEFEYVNIFLLPTAYQPDRINSLRQRFISRRITILFKTKDSLARFLRTGLHEARTSQNARSSVLGKFSLVVFAVYRQMIQDILDFLHRCTDQLDTLFFTGRHSPTETKIHYLLHLDDHLIKSVAELNIACTELKKWIKPSPPPWACKIRAELLIDLQYLESEFVKLRGRVKELKETVKELSDWAQMMRTIIITILVALYVPLSYVAAIFGMNVVEINGIWPPQNTTTNASSNNSDSTQRDAQPTSHWRLRSYWYTAVPLAVGTILLPLVVGPTFRTVAQFASRNRIYWRIIFPLALSSITIAAYWIRYWIPKTIPAIRRRQIIFLSNFIMGYILSGFSLSKAYFAWPLQRRKASKWVAFAAFTFLCTYLNASRKDHIGIIGFLPYVILFFGWMRPHIMLIWRMSRETA